MPCAPRPTMTLSCATAGGATGDHLVSHPARGLNPRAAMPSESICLGWMADIDLEGRRGAAHLEQQPTNWPVAPHVYSLPPFCHCAADVSGSASEKRLWLKNNFRVFSFKVGSCHWEQHWNVFCQESFQIQKESRVEKCPFICHRVVKKKQTNMDFCIFTFSRGLFFCRWTKRHYKVRITLWIEHCECESTPVTAATVCGCKKQEKPACYCWCRIMSVQAINMINLCVDTESGLQLPVRAVQVRRCGQFGKLRVFRSKSQMWKMCIYWAVLWVRVMRE